MKFIIAIIIAVIVFIHANNNKDKEENYREAREAHKARKRKSAKSKDISESKAQQKGEQGEQKVIDVLNNINIYGKILSNAYIPKQKGRNTTEIDIIYISEYGIHVIESKNYNGSIYGSDEYDEWIVYYRKSKDGYDNKYYFYNPVKQNENHLTHLKSLLNTVDENYFHPVVVFVDPWRLKVDSESSVVVLSELSSLIASQKNKVFSKSEVDKLYKLLKPYTNVNEKVKERHLAQAQRAKWVKNYKK